MRDGAKVHARSCTGGLRKPEGGWGVQSGWEQQIPVEFPPTVDWCLVRCPSCNQTASERAPGEPQTRDTVGSHAVRCFALRHSADQGYGTAEFDARRVLGFRGPGALAARFQPLSASEDAARVARNDAERRRQARSFDEFTRRRDEFRGNGPSPPRGESGDEGSSSTTSSSLVTYQYARGAGIVSLSARRLGRGRAEQRGGPSGRARAASAGSGSSARRGSDSPDRRGRSRDGRDARRRSRSRENDSPGFGSSDSGAAWNGRNYPPTAETVTYMGRAHPFSVQTSQLALPAATAHMVPLVVRDGTDAATGHMVPLVVRDGTDTRIPIAGPAPPSALPPVRIASTRGGPRRLYDALQPEQYAVVCGSGKYDETLVQVVSVHGATAIVTLAEEWEVRAESIRRAPQVYHGSNEPLRNMTVEDDPPSSCIGVVRLGLRARARHLGQRELRGGLEPVDQYDARHGHRP